MTVEAVYLLGVLLFWTGIGFLFRGIYKGLVHWTESPKPDNSLRELVGPFVVAAACLVAHSFLKLEVGRPVSGMHVPVAWVYMTFPGWMALVGVSMAVKSGLSAYTQVQAAEQVRRRNQVFVWLGLAALGVWWFVASSSRVWIFRGYIPVEVGTILGFGVLALVTVYAMVVVQRNAIARRWGRTVSVTLALVAGSCLFALPLGWQILTSFKEQVDQSTANGFVWVPKVQDVHLFMDPKHPLVEAKFDQTPVRAQILSDLGDGKKLLEIERPYALRGRRFETSASAYKPIQREAFVYSGKLEGQAVTAFVTEESESGVKTLEVLNPPTFKGRVFSAPTSELEAVRHVGLRWQNYTEALEWLPEETRGGLVYLQNTIVLVVLKVVATLVSSALVGYGFSRLRFPGRDFLFTVMLSTMMLPAAVTMMPQFLIFRSLGWIDTLNPLWAPSLFAGAFNVFLIKQFFSTIPIELEEAARIDGCGYFRTFWQVMLPQIQPALAAIGVWTFMGTWNDFLGPLIYISSPERMPLVYALAMFNSDRGTDVGLLMAFSTMALTPLLLLFFFAQRFFVEGVQLSGLGGR